MKIEYTHSEHDLKKKCYKCHWLKMIDGWNGICECPENRVRDRNRHILSKKCAWKNVKRM